MHSSTFNLGSKEAVWRRVYKLWYSILLALAMLFIKLLIALSFALCCYKHLLMQLIPNSEANHSITYTNPIRKSVKMPVGCQHLSWCLLPLCISYPSVALFLKLFCSSLPSSFLLPPSLVTSEYALSSLCSCNWRASEASETLIGLNNGNRRYIYIY